MDQEKHTKKGKRCSGVEEKLNIRVKNRKKSVLLVDTCSRCERIAKINDVLNKSRVRFENDSTSMDLIQRYDRLTR